MPKPFVIVELDQPRKLRYGMNQLVALEEALGVPLSELGRVKMGVKELRLFLWAGLSWEDPSLTLEKVGELVDEAKLTYEELAEKVVEAMQVAVGLPKNSIGPVAENGTGTKPLS